MLKRIAVVGGNDAFYQAVTASADGLEKDQIPYLARIVKVIDVYRAMTSLRHYPSGQSTHGDAVEYVRMKAVRLSTHG